MIDFLPVGRSDNKGVNCFYLNIEGTGILLDCGIHPRIKGPEALPNFDYLENYNIDAVIISHAHQDHIGALPFLIRRFPHVKIFMTPQSMAIAEITLCNAAKILVEQFADTDIKPYDREEIKYLMQTVNTFSYNEEFELNSFINYSSEPVKFEFYDAGHILGSSSILIEYKNKRIFYTGDIKLSDQGLIPGAKLPQKKIDTLIMEATYGSTDSETIGQREEEIKRFTNEANAVLSDGGSVLIPVFALGKNQEMLKILYDQMQSGKLTDVPIYSGGIAQKISKLYDETKYLVPRIDKNFELRNVTRENFYHVKGFESYLKNPCILLAPSGMVLPKTYSYKAAQKWMRDKNSAIFIIGYQDPDTPGYKISKAKRYDKITFNGSDEEIELKCKVSLFRFTAHSKREELIEIVNTLSPKNVILFHGDDDSYSWLGYHILEKVNLKLYIAEPFKICKL